MKSSVWQDLYWGVSWGGFAGLFFSAIALMIYLLGGQEHLDHQGITLSSLLVVYCLGGVLSGMLLGLLWPWTITRLGATLTGIPISVPFVGAIVFLLEGPFDDWGGRQIFGVILGAVILGSLGGWELWKLWDDVDRITR